MAGTIEINNLRNIQALRFDIPDSGVWLLTAGNGAGKTSLLACIRRIGHSNAFPVHFPSSLRSERLDNHASGSVTYSINGESVTYAYKGERWTPTPKKNSNLFAKFGYPTVTYIGATADRITPRPEDFAPRQIKAAPKAIIDAANDIFDTNKFSMLKTINLKRGVGNEAFVLAMGGNPQTYHSEKHFSLGELCVLKLLKHLSTLSNNSLVIVDELEMALHPKAQVRLLRYLEAQAKKKSLVVIFSTHSVTLLKAIDHRQIIYLERSEGAVRPIVGCYPTYAIGNIASEEETLPDLMIYVEDVFARDMSMAFFGKFADAKYDDPTIRPTAKIVPVGGFKEVVAFLERNRAVLPDYCLQRAALDADVFNETLESWRRAENHAELAKFQPLSDWIKSLPFTPEIGLMEYVAANVGAVEQSLRQRCADNQIRIGDIARRYDGMLQGAPQRKSAKEASDTLIDYLARRTQRSRDSAREELCGVFASLSWDQYKVKFMQMFGAMLKR